MRVGAALCWEQCRYRTARRMTGRVDLVLAATAWPFGSPQDSISRENPVAARGLLVASDAVQETPRRFSRLVGAPVVHASLVGESWNSAHQLSELRACCGFQVKAKSRTRTAERWPGVVMPRVKDLS